MAEEVVSEYIDNDNDRVEPFYIDDESGLNFFPKKVLKLKKDAIYGKGITLIFLQYYLQVNDRFILNRYPNVVYYITKFDKLHGDGTKSFEIKRADGAVITGVDLLKLTAKETITLKGHFYNK